jgi:sterol desaturase/sphingolipid hydroxylase (fatty acid hydroxylase superfamily)
MILLLHILILTICSFCQDSVVNFGKVNIVILNALLWYINAFSYLLLDGIYDIYEGTLNGIGINKIHDKREQRTFYDMFCVANRNLLLNHSLVLLTISLTDRGFNKSVTSLPAMAWELLLYYIVHDITFFCLHWAIHRPNLYKHHKLHHTTFGTVAISCFYMDILDALLELYMPFIVPILLVNGHFVTTFAWSIIAIVNTFSAHSGYGRGDHYLHHSLQVKNFSVYITDVIMGTRVEE